MMNGKTQLVLVAVVLLLTNTFLSITRLVSGDSYEFHRFDGDIEADSEADESIVPNKAFLPRDFDDLISIRGPPNGGKCPINLEISVIMNMTLLHYSFMQLGAFKVCINNQHMANCFAVDKTIFDVVLNYNVGFNSDLAVIDVILVALKSRVSILEADPMTYESVSIDGSPDYYFVTQRVFSCRLANLDMHLVERSKQHHTNSIRFLGTYITNINAYGFPFYYKSTSGILETVQKDEHDRRSLSRIRTLAEVGRDIAVCSSKGWCNPVAFHTALFIGSSLLELYEDLILSLTIHNIGIIIDKRSTISDAYCSPSYVTSYCCLTNGNHHVSDHQDFLSPKYYPTANFCLQAGIDLLIIEDPCQSEEISPDANEDQTNEISGHNHCSWNDSAIVIQSLRDTKGVAVMISQSSNLDEFVTNTFDLLEEIFPTLRGLFQNLDDNQWIEFIAVEEIANNLKSSRQLVIFIDMFHLSNRAAGHEVIQNTSRKSLSHRKSVSVLNLQARILRNGNNNEQSEEEFEEDVAGEAHTEDETPSKQQMSDDASAPTPDDSFVSSSVSFSFKYGRNMAILRNACFYNQSTVALFRAHGGQDGILSPELREFLVRSYSGFYTVASSTRWAFLELDPILTDPSLRHQKNYSQPHFAAFHSSILPGGSEILLHHWTKGSALAMIPPYSPSVFHASQVLLQIVDIVFRCAKHGHQHRNKHAFAPDTPAFDEELFSLLRSVKAFVFPSIERTDYGWTLSMIDVIRHYFTDKINILYPSSPITLPKTLFSEDVVVLFNFLIRQSGTLSQESVSSSTWTHSVICYDEIILLGSLELSLPFLSAKEIAIDFQQYLYNYLKLKPSANANPNDPLKITVLMRPKNRWILNLDQVLHTIVSTGVADRNWLSTHVLQFEGLSFYEQVKILSETDIFVAPHGAALINLMFLRPQSAAIEIFTSPWYEIGYQPTALMFDIHYQVIPQVHMDRFEACTFPAFCVEDSFLLVRRKDLQCYGLRQCNGLVDLGLLEISIWQASQSVRILKRGLYNQQTMNDCAVYESNHHVTTGQITGSDSWKKCTYHKTYETPLS